MRAINDLSKQSQQQYQHHNLHLDQKLRRSVPNLINTEVINSGIAIRPNVAAAATTTAAFVPSQTRFQTKYQQQQSSIKNLSAKPPQPYNYNNNQPQQQRYIYTSKNQLINKKKLNQISKSHILLLKIYYIYY